MKINLRRLAAAAVIAAIYCSLTMLSAPIAYGMAQLRISEALCVLPFFAPWTVWGLFAGCAAANLLSPAGIWDLVLGSTATLLAGLCTAGFGKRYRSGGGLRLPERLLGCAMPVLFNGVIIGAMLAVLFPLGGGFWLSFLIIGLQVAAGEAAVMLVLGLPLMSFLPRINMLKRIA